MIFPESFLFSACSGFVLKFLVLVKSSIGIKNEELKARIVGIVVRSLGLEL